MEVDSIACGGTTPDFCSDLLGTAYGQDVSNDIWERASMPVTHSTWTLGDPDPGEAFAGPQEVNLLGLQLASPAGTWPSAWNSAGLTWVDHDGDGPLGVTSTMRLTGNSPSCGLPYGPLPVPSDPFGPGVKQLHLGSRTLARLNGKMISCNTMGGPLAGPDNGKPKLDGRVRGCVKATANSAPCVQSEWASLDTSGGGATQSIVDASFTMVRVPSNTTCAQVRAMTFPVVPPSP